MADMHTPLLIAINEEGDERAIMRFDDLPSIRSVIDTLIDWQETDPTRRLAIRAPSQDAETIKALRAETVEEVLSLLTAHELYRYRPKAFDGFIEYARTALAGSAS